MRLLADKDIPYIHELFGSGNQIIVHEGRMINYKHLKHVDILIIRSVTRVNYTLLRDNPVKFIGTATSGTDHIDKNYLKNCNIQFVSAPGSNAISVVEYVLTALFWLAKRNHFFLRDKVVGIVGVGNIGNLLHQRLHDFGVQTLLYDPYLSKTNTNNTWKSLEQLVSESDILTLHTPLTYTGKYPTWHMINLDVLDSLAPDTILINTSRGAVIDNTALLKVLRCGKKINVILDVWESEPNISIALLSYVDIGTAHIAGYTFDSKIRSIIQIYNKYCNYFNISINKEKISCLFPSSITATSIKIFDEIYLNRLISSIYNIYYDHLALKCFASQVGGFDLLRKRSCNRREWSSLFIKTKKDSINEILINLGFNIF